jgi:hypothetical protein
MACSLLTVKLFGTTLRQFDEMTCPCIDMATECFILHDRVLVLNYISLYGYALQFMLQHGTPAKGFLCCRSRRTERDGRVVSDPDSGGPVLKFGPEAGYPEMFRGFSQVQTDARMFRKSGHDHFSPHHLQFVINL